MLKGEVECVVDTGNWNDSHRGVPLRIESPSVRDRMVITVASRGLAAAIVYKDESDAMRFLDAYGGAGTFWNTSTPELHGFRLTERRSRGSTSTMCRDHQTGHLQRFAPARRRYGAAGGDNVIPDNGAYVNVIDLWIGRELAARERRCE